MHGSQRVGFARPEQIRVQGIQCFAPLCGFAFHNDDQHRMGAGLWITFFTADEGAIDAFVKHVEIAAADGTPAIVEFVKVPVEPEERAEHGRIEKVHQRMKFINEVLDGRAGEDEGVPAAETFHRLRGLGAPVFDALGFVEHDNIRREPRIYVQRVGHHLLIVDDGEKRRGGVLVVRLETADFAPENDLVIQRCSWGSSPQPLRNSSARKRCGRGMMGRELKHSLDNLII
jgi:hypothetical protein